MPTPNVPNSEDPHHFTSTSSIPTISPKPTSTPPPPPATPSTPTSTPRSPSHSSPSPPPPSSSHPPNTLENKPSPTPTSPNVPSPSSQNGTLTDAIKDEVLQDHNDYRAKHGASNLTWADDLAQYAANLVAKCVFKHSGGPHGGTSSDGLSLVIDNTYILQRTWLLEVEFSLLPTGSRCGLRNLVIMTPKTPSTPTSPRSFGRAPLRLDAP